MKNWRAVLSWREHPVDIPDLTEKLHAHFEASETYQINSIDDIPENEIFYPGEDNIGESIYTMYGDDPVNREVMREEILARFPHIKDRIFFNDSDIILANLIQNITVAGTYTIDELTAKCNDSDRGLYNIREVAAAMIGRIVEEQDYLEYINSIYGGTLEELEANYSKLGNMHVEMG